MHFDPENRSARGHRGLRTDWTQASQLPSAWECEDLLRHRSGARLRSGVKGHFSYREIAWEMKVKMEQLEPELGRLIDGPLLTPLKHGAERGT
jgi:hypothetical protein